MKYMQVIAHTTGGEVVGASEQVTERDYETWKEMLVEIPKKDSLVFDVEDGCVVIPTSQILYVELRLS